MDEISQPISYTQLFRYFTTYRLEIVCVTIPLRESFEHSTYVETTEWRFCYLERNKIYNDREMNLLWG